MGIPERITRRFLARSAPAAEYFEDEVGHVRDTHRLLRAYGAGLMKARDILRPVAECLRSKALAKIYVELTDSIDQVPLLLREVEGILADLLKIDHELLDEQQRHTELILAAGDDDYKIQSRDVRVPVAALKALDARMKKYEKAVEKAFDRGFSLDDIGTAGSPDLRVYEKVFERLDSWEELNMPEIDLRPDILVESIMDRASSALD
jgi:hypothetical protein